MAASGGRWVSVQEMLKALATEEDKEWDRLVGFTPLMVNWPPKIKLVNFST